MDGALPVRSWTPSQQLAAWTAATAPNATGQAGGAPPRPEPGPRWAQVAPWEPEPESSEVSPCEDCVLAQDPLQLAQQLPAAGAYSQRVACAELVPWTQFGADGAGYYHSYTAPVGPLVPDTCQGTVVAQLRMSAQVSRRGAVVFGARWLAA